MPTYELYNPPDVLRYRLIIHDDGRPEWDFNRDEWGGKWLDEETHADLIREVEFFERHRPRDTSFTSTKGYTVRRAPAP
jgi:hypothetical protein